MQRHDTGTRSTLRLATGMAATLAVASLALATIVTAEHRENGRWVGTWSASPQAVASPVQTAIASDRHDDGHREQWVGTWGNALHQPDLGVPGLNNSGFNNQTLRQIVHVSARRRSSARAAIDFWSEWLGDWSGEYRAERYGSIDSTRV